MIEVKDLYAGYGGPDVLSGVSFSLGDGETLSVIGPNGCGKTTLLRVIAGILPHRGSIRLDDKPVSSMKRKDIARKVAIMTQLSHIYFSYSVYDTVMMGRYLHIRGGLLPEPSEGDRTAVEECLRAVGLYDAREQEITRLSGGQLQRVFLARTLAQDPQIILLDEPTNHLDLKYQVELIDYLKDFSARKKRSVVGVFHDINMAMNLSDNALLMKDGLISRTGSLAAMIRDKTLNAVYGMDINAYMLGALKRWSCESL